MKHQVLRQRSRRLVSCLFFGGLLLVVPQLMAQKPTLNQTSSGSSSSSSVGSGSSSSSSSSRSSASSGRSSSSSSRSSASSRSSSRNSRPSASAPRRSDGAAHVPTRRGDVRRQRSARENPPAQPSASSGSSQSSNANHRGGYHHDNRYRYGHGYGRHGYHYHRPGCGHYGYGYYGYGYPYRYYGPFGYIYYHRPHISVHSGGGYYSQDMGALDLDVRPEKAQIFVDGTLVGVADQYDGFPAYLWLEKGTYDIVIYKEGYQTISRQYTIYPGVVADVNDRMVAGDAVKPEDLFAKSTARRDERRRRNEERRAAAEARSGAQVEMRQQSGDSEQGIARLLLNVSPGDAAAYLDGHFLGTAGELGQLSAGLIVEPGDHMLEVVRPGYETQRVPIQIPAGDKITIELELAPR